MVGALLCSLAPLPFARRQGSSKGDPLGPLLFAAALQPVAAELRNGPLDLAMFYLDDGVVAGDLPAVGAALAHVQQRAAPSARWWCLAT